MTPQGCFKITIDEIGNSCTNVKYFLVDPSIKWGFTIDLPNDPVGIDVADGLADFTFVIVDITFELFLRAPFPLRGGQNALQM